MIDRGDEDDGEDEVTEEDEADALDALADVIAGDDGDIRRAVWRCLRGAVTCPDDGPARRARFVHHRP